VVVTIHDSLHKMAEAGGAGRGKPGAGTGKKGVSRVTRVLGEAGDVWCNVFITTRPELRDVANGWEAQFKELVDSFVEQSVALPITFTVTDDVVAKLETDYDVKAVKVWGCFSSDGLLLLTLLVGRFLNGL
jgi:hypothetical protein